MHVDAAAICIWMLLLRLHASIVPTCVECARGMGHSTRRLDNNNDIARTTAAMLQAKSDISEVAAAAAAAAGALQRLGMGAAPSCSKPVVAVTS